MFQLNGNLLINALGKNQFENVISYYYTDVVFADEKCNKLSITFMIMVFHI